MAGKVYIVHAIDTEGPLFESIESTFERLEEIFGIKDIDPTPNNLEKIRNGKIHVGPESEVVIEAISKHRVSTLGTWSQIKSMLENITSSKSRNTLKDSDGNGWVFNWFCLDHVGFKTNPRKRDLGFHKVHDVYSEMVKEQVQFGDTIQWHFHPMSTYREAHRCATHYFRSDEIYQILTRRIIERKFFPSCFRAGFQAERPDSHWFLEQFIPFDISNMATKDTTDIDSSIDFKNGRSGNWRQAPSDWSVYHPSHDDYQVPGFCRRLIGRALNLRNRIGNLTQEETNTAFQQAQLGKDVLFGVCSHDWRDMSTELESVRSMIQIASEKYPEVEFIYSTADEAFRAQLTSSERAEKDLKLQLAIVPEDPGVDVPYIEVTATQGKVFGPQPFLAIKTKDGNFIHDNFDFSVTKGKWFYAFHADTLPFENVEEIGVAANDMKGNTVVLNHRTQG